MPYSKFTKIVDGKKKWCIRKLSNGKVTCYDSPQKRETGIKMREAFAHGMKPLK